MISEKLTFKVRYAETDQMKIAHHSNYIVWFEMARIDFMEKIGIFYSDLEKEGYLMPVVEVNAVYNKPAVFADNLTIKTIIKEKPGARLRFDYMVYNDNNEQICSGFSIHGFMNKENRAIKPPRVLRQKLKDYF